MPTEDLCTSPLDNSWMYYVFALGEDDWTDWEGKRCSNTVQVFQTCVSGGLLVFKQSLSVSRWSDRLVPIVNTVGWRKSLSHVCKAHICLLAVFEPGQEEQPLSKCVLPNSLLRCMPITNRADKKSTPKKVNLDTHVFQAHKARGESGRSNAKSELWATWGSVSRNVTAAKAL